MSKKFLAGVFAVAAFAFAITVSAAYDFGATTLKVGSRGEAVKNVQIVVGATPVDGIFRAMTKAKVMAWQAANGLTADGLFGAMSKAKANAVVVTPTTPTTPSTPSTPSTTLKGGAGDSNYSSYSTGVKSSIKDGEEDVKVAGLKIEAIDSDVEVNNIKVQVRRDGTTSTKVSKYIESVDIYMGSKKVGSEDVSDFSKDGEKYYKSISLSNAVVKADEKEAFLVVFNAASDIDDANNNKNIKVDIMSYRFTDGMGVVSTKDVVFTEKSVKLDLIGADDVTLKSSSSNPSDATISVKENNTTDDVLALAFKFDNDEDSSSDATITSIPVLLTFGGSNLIGDTSDADWAEKVVESVMLKIDGAEFEGELKTDSTNGAATGTAEYTFDLDGEDVVIEKGDTVEAKVYITFAEQKNNYSSGITVKAEVTSVDGDLSILAEDKDEEAINITDGTKVGGVLTLSVSPALVTGVTASSKTDTNSKIGTYTFKFSVEADGADAKLTSSTITHKTTAAADKVSFNIIKNSGTAVVSGDGYKVEDGNKATFTVTYTITGVAGSFAVTLDKVAGVTIDQTVGPESLVL